MFFLNHHLDVGRHPGAVQDHVERVAAGGGIDLRQFVNMSIGDMATPEWGVKIGTCREFLACRDANSTSADGPQRQILQRKQMSASRGKAAVMRTSSDVGFERCRHWCAANLPRAGPPFPM